MPDLPGPLPGMKGLLIPAAKGPESWHFLELMLLHSVQDIDQKLHAIQDV